MTSGIPSERLSDEDLRHDLLQLKRKQADIEADGTADQKLNHQSRTAELESEFVKRFGSDTSESDSDEDDPDGSYSGSSGENTDQ